ncbi:MAG: hypothetical protein O7G88_14110 [bacterium]|nr:hypothetical protein [bacterium]
MNRQDILRAWMDENERGPAWVAKKVGRTRELISRVYHGHLPLSDNLASDLHQILDIPSLDEKRLAYNGTQKKAKKKGTPLS